MTVSNPQEDHLLLLVRTLSASERRFISKEFKHKQSRDAVLYKRMYELYVRLRFHDEEVIRDALSDPAFPSHLAVLRSQCFNWLLDRLRKLHDKQDVGDQIYALVQEARILFERELMGAARKKAMAAKRLMESHSRYEFAGELHRILLNLELVANNNNPEKAIEIIESMTTRQMALMSDQSEVVDYWGMCHQLALVQHLAAGHTLQTLVFNKAQEADLRPSRSMLGEVYRLQGIGILAVHQQAFEKAYSAFLEIAKIYRSNSNLASRVPENYWVNLHNLCQLSIHLREYATVLSSLEELKGAYASEAVQNPAKKFRLLVYYFGSLFSARTQFPEMGNFEADAEALEVAVHDLALVGGFNTLPSLLNIFLNVGALHIYNGTPGKAFRWLGRITVMAAKGEPELLVYRAELLTALAQIEKGDYDSFQSKLNHFRRQNQILGSRNETLILDFLIAIGNVQREAEARQLRMALLSDFSTWRQSVGQQPVFFDVARWLNRSNPKSA